MRNLILLAIAIGWASAAYPNDCASQYDREAAACNSAYNKDEKSACIRAAQQKNAECYRASNAREMEYKCSKPENKGTTDCEKRRSQ